MIACIGLMQPCMFYKCMQWTCLKYVSCVVKGRVFGGTLILHKSLTLCICLRDRSICLRELFWDLDKISYAGMY